MTSTILFFFFQLILTAAMILFINLFGSVKRGYVTVDHLLSATNLGYNLIYRILSPAIFISFITIVLYSIGLPKLINNIWLISVYYFALNLGVLIIIRRFPLVNKFLYFFIAFSSIGISYWLYTNVLKNGLNAILPDSANFKTKFSWKF